MKADIIKILLLLIASFPLVNHLKSLSNGDDGRPAANAMYAGHQPQVESNRNILSCNSTFTYKETNNIAAHDAVLQGREHIFRFTPGDFAKALSYFEKAVELDPNYSLAHAWLAYTYWKGSDLGWHQSLHVSWQTARLRARQCLRLAMKNPTALAHHAASDMILRQRLHGQAIAEAQRAIDLDPNDPVGHITMASALIYVGRPEQAIDYVKRAKRLDPNLPGIYLFHLGLAHFCMGKLEEAVTLIERGLTHNPEVRPMALILAPAYALLGRDQKARSTLEGFMEWWPMWPLPPDLRLIMYMFPFKDPEVADRFADGLLKSGLPGEPSGYYKISEKHKLTGQEIRALVFGRTVTGFFPMIGQQWWTDRTVDGKATHGGGLRGTDSGTSWIEGDMLCEKWQSGSQGCEYCAPVFRNPEGTPEKKDEYLSVTDFGILPWSLGECDC